MIILLGTGHVFDLSSAVREMLEEEQPDVVGVELDRQRYNALMMKQQDQESYKMLQKDVPTIYKLLARFQDSMAHEYGVEAGDEMLAAISYAQSHQVPLRFIDMNAQKLFSKMLRSMSLREKIRLFFSGFAGFFISKKKVERELKNIEDTFESYLEQIGKKFPTIKRVLIDDRNAFMVKQLMTAQAQYGKVAAVVGDGHVPGLSTLLKNQGLEVKTIRLSALRAHTSSPKDTSTASFSIGYKPLE